MNLLRPFRRLPPSVSLIRSFAPLPLMLDLIQYVERAYAEFDAHATHADFEQTRDWGGLNMGHLKARLGAGPILGAVEDYITGKFRGSVALTAYSSFRRVRDDRTYIRWHTDADGAGSRNLKGNVWNCWLPLTTVGLALPSLELMDKSESVVRKLAARPSDDAEFKPREIAERFPGQEPYCPAMEIGDALVFSHWVLHRTQSLPRPWHGERIGSEFRFQIR